MMGTPVLILGDSGAGKSYSLRNFNPDDVMLLQCIPKMLPFKSAGWKLHGKLLPDGSKQRGNVLRSDNWETVLDTIYRMVQSKTRRVLIIDDFQVVMQHENMNRAYQTGYAKFTEWQITSGESSWRPPSCRTTSAFISWLTPKRPRGRSA